jgi:uncharacterized protein YceH (UPF0502 family)
MDQDDELIRERALDDRLTDSYAHLLALETECLAVTRCLTAASKGGSDGSGQVGQMAIRLDALRAEIAELRARLDDRRRTIDPKGQLY